MEQEYEIVEEKGDKVWKLLVIGSFIGVIVIISVGAYIYTTQIQDGKWSCIAEQCVEFATGDDWIEDNCNPIQGQMVCYFVLDNKDYNNVPLNQIPLDRMASCKRYECNSYVFLRQVKGGSN